MSWIALKMLTGDTAKFFGIVLGLTFAALLITQQGSIFCGLMRRTAGQVEDIRGADLWVMDANVRYIDDVKPMLLGHWGTTPGQNFIYAHLNRVIRQYDLNMIYLSGPGHGGPALVANTYLEGSYSEIYPEVSQDEAGLKRLFTQFSFPGGIPSHVSPECPGSIHEGGELGYSLSHAFGAVFDNPDFIAACAGHPPAGPASPRGRDPFPTIR